jgi:hypothetical protein
MCDILCDSLTDILSKNEKKVTIYIGIGTQIHMSTRDDITGYLTLDPMYDHQYPICLKTLKNLCPHDPLYIYLMDPMLNVIPYIVENKYGDGLEDGWVLDNFKGIQLYHNMEMNIHVYCIKKYVIYPYDKIINGSDYIINYEPIDLNNFFDQLNEMAITNNWFVVAHDFSGKNIGKMAYYYDDILKDHLNHIVYGIGCRDDDDGCYIDLVQPKCQFIYEINEDRITVFNPFNYNNLTELYDVYEAYNICNTYYDCDDKIIDDNILIIHNMHMNIIKQQIQYYIKSISKLISDDIMTVLRRIANLDLEKDFDINMIDKISLCVYSKTQLNIIELIKEKKYKLIISSLIEILKLNLEKILCYKYNKNTKSIIDIAIDSMLYNKDPYQWHMNINRLLREIK